jgi:hypothetical protein
LRRSGGDRILHAQIEIFPAIRLPAWYYGEKEFEQCSGLPCFPSLPAL